MADKKLNPIRRLGSHVPRNSAQLETEMRRALKVAFWAALLAPVIIVPLYYLLVALFR